MHQPNLNFRSSFASNVDLLCLAFSLFLGGFALQAEDKAKPDEAAALNAQVMQLYQQGKFADLSAVVPIASAPARPRPGGRRIRTKAEAVPIAKKVLELRLPAAAAQAGEKALGPACLPPAWEAIL